MSADDVPGPIRIFIAMAIVGFIRVIGGEIFKRWERRTHEKYPGQFPPRSDI
jgi:hypothetical protein